MKKLSLASVRRVILIAPHPDDEAIAAFGLVHCLHRMGVDVRIIIVTDGSASHHSRLWPAARLKARRKTETRLAMRRAGLAAGALRFLDYEDSALETLKGPELKQLQMSLQQAPEPDMVVRPAACDFHADHRIVAQVCCKAWPPRVKHLTYLVWPAEDTRRFLPRYRFFLRPGSQRMKSGAVKSYRTQTGLISDDPSGFCMDRPLLRRFVRPSEVFGEG